MNRASNLCIALAAIASGCGGAPTSPARAANSAEGHAPTESVARAAANTPVEPVSWTLFATLSIDPTGRVHADRDVLGTFEGDVLRDGSEEVARLDADGRLFLGGVRSSMRVVGNALQDDDASTAFLSIEGDALVVVENGESIPITHFRPEETRRVLLVSALVLSLVGQSYDH